MTYTPLWEQDAAKSREAIALTAHFPKHVRSALTHVATTLTGHHLTDGGAR